MVHRQPIFKNQNVADICEKTNNNNSTEKSISNQLIPYLFSFVLGCIYYYYFFRETRVFFFLIFFFILLVIQIFSLCALSFFLLLLLFLDLLFSCTVCLILLFSFSVFFSCSNYLDDVAQLNTKDLISSSLSSFSYYYY